MSSPRRPDVGWRDRTLVVLVGVVLGYVVGRVLEDGVGWHGALMVTMPLGGLATGVVARFAIPRFRPRAAAGARGARGG